MLKETEKVLIDFRVVGLRDALPHQSASFYNTERNINRTPHRPTRLTSHTQPERNRIRLSPIEAGECTHSPYRT